jgi:predicted ATP-dependent endonuclease of OLD family
MKLKKVQIKDFRCIEDSGEFTIDDVTCLVGKNESGKTAILKALHKLKPAGDESEKFEPAKDYPKRKWRPDIAVPSEPPAISTTWEFEERDLILIEEKLGKGVITDNTFILSNGYENTPNYELSIDENVLARNLIESVGLTDEEKKLLIDVKTVSDIGKALGTLAQRTENQEKLFQTISKEYKNGTWKAILQLVHAMVPSFLYFDQYLKLSGEISVNELLKRKSENRLDDKDRIFIALLSLAGTTLETVHNAKTFEEFNSALRAVSNQVSEQIFKYWSQNRHLDVQMRLDNARPEDPHPYNSGYVFRTRIDNKRHRADTGFDERSSGFVWFFSFLVWFNEIRKTYNENLIILLDEPGLTLHARAQADLLRYIREQLKPEHQVIYTTHSPFMIDADKILSARTVEDVVKIDPKTKEETLFGTKVSGDVLSTDPDTISPLQRVLDYEITQTLFIGKRTILVEGESDFLYLKWFSKQLENLGKPGLDYRWTISIVKGIDRIPGFISLFAGNQIKMVALTDFHLGQKQKIENVRKSLPDGNLLTVDQYTGKKEADIEDVFGDQFYLELVNHCFKLKDGVKLEQSKLNPQLRIVPQVENHFATLPPYNPEFNHFIPSEYLFQNIEDGGSLPGFDFALSKMEQLIRDLNSLL